MAVFWSFCGKNNCILTNIMVPQGPEKLKLGSGSSGQQGRACCLGTDDEKRGREPRAGGHTGRAELGWSLRGGLTGRDQGTHRPLL